MRKRAKIALAALLAAVLAVVGWQVLRPQEREPVYQGKGLREWLAENGYAWARQDAHAQEITQAAIRHIGTNAIPILLDMLRRKDSSLVSILIPFWDRHIMSSHYPLPAWVRCPSWYQNKALVFNLRALKGFEVLGADARQAVPALIEIYDRNISPDSQQSTSRALIAIGPEAARAAVPSFVRQAANPDPRVRLSAVWALGDVHAEPSRVVPALVKALSDTNASVRTLAALSLDQVGFAAKPAVPALLQRLSDPDAQVRRIAAQALRRIDYDAAVKAGLK
jgi:hypothetical protein